MGNGMQFHCKTIRKCKESIKKKTKIDLLLHHLLSLFYGLLCIPLNYHVKNKNNSFPYKRNTYKDWKTQDSITGKITTPIILSFRDVNTLGIFLQTLSLNVF